MSFIQFVLYFLILFIPCSFGYLIGSIPFGLLITKFAGYGDIRNIGSGNIGATNVLRTGNKKLAISTFLLDAAKGAVAIFLISCLFGSAEDDKTAVGHFVLSAVGLAAILGHMCPIWLKFKGGKGVATSFGVILALCWPAGLLGFATWLAVAFVTRISSLSALITAALAPLYIYLIEPQSKLKIIAVGIIAIMIIAKHHANIRRLLNGTESKISFSSNTSPLAGEDSDA